MKNIIPLWNQQVNKFNKDINKINYDYYQRCPIQQWILGERGETYTLWVCNKCGYKYIESKFDLIKHSLPRYCPHCNQEYYEDRRYTNAVPLE